MFRGTPEATFVSRLEAAAVRDIKFALRLFASRRMFFVTTVLTIALGVSLSATVFAIVDGVLFRSLPYRDPSRLVALYGAARADRQWTMPLSVPDLMDWREASQSFAEMEAYDSGQPGARIRGSAESVQSRCSAVTPGFLEMLGVSAAYGRTFAADDFRPGAPAVALISHGLWMGVYAGAPDVLGRTVGIGTGQRTIVGVLPRSFVFPAPGRRFAPEVLVPFNPVGRSDDRSARLLYVIGRRSPGVSLQQAQTEMDAIALRLKPLFVGRPNVIPGAFDGATLMDLRHNMTRASRSGLWLVFGAVAVVFLIACVNVVGLLLANAEDRKRELAIRAAIGADRATLTRQLLIETGVLAAIGGTAGWLLSMVALPAVLNRIPPWLQLVGDPQLDARSVVFVGILALVTVIAGMLPAFRSSADAPRAALAIGTVRASPSRRGRHALILVEVALATILLCAGSIMLRSSLILHSQDTGMDAAQSSPCAAFLPARPTPHGAHFTTSELLKRSGVFPGSSPLRWSTSRCCRKRSKDRDSFHQRRHRRSDPPRWRPISRLRRSTPNDGPCVAYGSDVDVDDRGRRVVISETLAKRYWPGRNPVGETIRYGDGTREIAGVVSDARDVSLDRPPMPTLYHVWDEKDAPIATMVIRFGGRAAMLMPEIRRAVRIADDDAAITMLSTVEDLLTASARSVTSTPSCSPPLPSRGSSLRWSESTAWWHSWSPGGRGTWASGSRSARTAAGSS